MTKPKPKVTAIRFADEELALLDMIQGHTGIKSRTEALRTILQHYVESKKVEAATEPAPPADKP
jgi:metal-responsive CopG/Arc/MetJ family transcriptional regulator